jgi:hypothetical protein
MADLLPDILARAAEIPLSAATVPAYAQVVTTEASTAFRWSADLLSGASRKATVTTTAWLDDRGRLIRQDRETVPLADSDVAHTYTSITYSRFADPDLVAPVPPQGFGG